MPWSISTTMPMLKSKVSRNKKQNKNNLSFLIPNIWQILKHILPDNFIKHKPLISADSCAYMVKKADYIIFIFLFSKWQKQMCLQPRKSYFPVLFFQYFFPNVFLVEILFFSYLSPVVIVLL